MDGISGPEGCVFLSANPPSVSQVPEVHLARQKCFSSGFFVLASPLPHRYLPRSWRQCLHGLIDKVSACAAIWTIDWQRRTAAVGSGHTHTSHLFWRPPGRPLQCHQRQPQSSHTLLTHRHFHHGTQRIYLPGTREGKAELSGRRCLPFVSHSPIPAPRTHTQHSPQYIIKHWFVTLSPPLTKRPIRRPQLHTKENKLNRTKQK